MKFSKLGALWFLLCFLVQERVVYCREATGTSLPVDNRPTFFGSAINSRKISTSANSRAEASAPGIKVERHAEHDGAQIIHKPNGFLTAPTPIGAVGIMGPRVEARDVVAGFMDRQQAVFGHDSGILTNSILKQNYVTPHNGLRTLFWEQHHQGIPIYGAHYAAHVTAQGELVNVSGRMFPDPAHAVRAGTEVRKVAAIGRRLTATRALILAAHESGENLDEEQQVVPVRGKAAGTEQKQFLQSPSVINEACAYLTWLPMDAATLRLCWDVTWTGRKSQIMYRSFVDAETGEIWVRQSLTRHTVPAYRIYGSHSPTPLMPGYSIPSAAQPSEVARVLVDSSSLNTNASPSGWINPETDKTRGNNVDAYADNDHNLLPDGNTYPTAADLVFDFPLQLNANPPASYNEAIIVNAFYWCNWMHDRLFELGFNEQAGNMQTTNFSGSPGGNDAVKVLVNYGANDLFNFNYQNVAAMSTPVDGQTPYLYLGLFVSPDPDRAAALDIDALLHEYVHGMTARLVGRLVGVSKQQSMGMDEGWSDYFPFCLQSQPQDDLGANYPMAAYVSYLFGSILSQNYYFGIRRYPYSTNLTINPLTLKDIAPTQADPHFGVPRNPAIDNTADEVHNMGEVWCAMLWEMRANLILKLGFTNGNYLAMQLVVDGQKLGPTDPTFLQARDAILQAEQVLCNGTNRLEIWRAFAKRGLGASAVVPVSHATADIIENYDLPDALAISTEPIPAYGLVGGPFNAVTNIYRIVNTSTNTVNWTVASDNLATFSPVSGVLSAGQTGLVTFAFSSIPNSFSNGLYTNLVVFRDEESGISLQRRIYLMVGYEPLVETFESNRFDLQYTSLTFTPDLTGTNYLVCRTAVTNFPTDLTGATNLTMGDDTYAPIDLTDGQSVAVMGFRTNHIYMVSNGHISLQLGRNDAFYPSPEEMYACYRAIGFYQDLNPATGGTVAYQQLEDRFVGTWLNVPEYGSNNVNNVQIEMFFDGRIRMTWLRADANPVAFGLVDNKGIPKHAINRDFSTTEVCDPVLTLVVPAQATEGNGVLTNQATVSILAPVATNQVIWLRSSETNKLRVTNSVTIPAGETTVAFDLEAVDLPNLDGDLTVRVTAEATNFASARALMVVRDNDSPQLFLEIPAEVTEGQGILTNAGRLSVVGPMITNLLLRLTSSVPEKVSLPSSLLLAAGQTSLWFNLNVASNQIPNEQTIVGVGAGGLGLIPTNQLLVVKDDIYQLLFLHTNTFGEALRIEWPDYASNYVLESATQISSNAWQVVSNGIVITNEFRVLSLPMNQSNQFFRLRRP